MSSEDRDTLRACPTCGTKNKGENAKNLGLRDYSWFSAQLPGRVGASDLDAVVDQRSSGRVLIHEYKPKGVALPLGQRLLLRRFVELGCDVWVIWEDTKTDTVQVGDMSKEGEVLFIEDMSKNQLGAKVKTWWNLGLELNNTGRP